MIKTAVVAMTLLGCDCDAKVCEYIGDTAPQWDSVQSCQSAVEREVTSRQDLQYPLITAECHSNEPEIAQSEPTKSETAQVAPSKSLADRIADGTLIAFRQTEHGYEMLWSGLQFANSGVASGATSVLAAAIEWIGY